MLRRFPTFPMTRTLAVGLAAASLALTATLPAVAQTTQSNSGDASASASANQNKTQQKPASKRLPEPKASDYAASTFNAPSDDALDHFMATHQPPKPAKQSDGSDNADGPSQGNAAAQHAMEGTADSDTTTNAGASNANGGA